MMVGVEGFRVVGYSFVFRAGYARGRCARQAETGQSP